MATGSDTTNKTLLYGSVSFKTTELYSFPMVSRELLKHLLMIFVVTFFLLYLRCKTTKEVKTFFREMNTAEIPAF